jgi:ERCC4-type nuclease
MTVFVDDRVGSRELLRPLKRAGCSVKETRLDFGDVIVPVNGPQGEIRIAVERKRVDEMVGAIMDPRFTSRQLPGLLTHFPLSYLVIEGGYRQGPQGELLVGWGREAGFTKQRFLYDTFEHFLLSIEIQTTLHNAGRLRVKRTQSLYETVAFVAAMASWGRKRWQDHGSFKVVDEARVGSSREVGFEEQSTKRSVAAQLPGVYWKRSAAAASHFPSIFQMIIAGEQKWRGVEGIGPKTAKRIVKAIRERS